MYTSPRSFVKIFGFLSLHDMAARTSDETDCHVSGREGATAYGPRFRQVIQDKPADPHSFLSKQIMKHAHGVAAQVGLRR